MSSRPVMSAIKELLPDPVAPMTAIIDFFDVGLLGDEHDALSEVVIGFVHAISCSLMPRNGGRWLKSIHLRLDML